MNEYEIDVFKNVTSANIIGKLYDNWLTSDFLDTSFRSYSSFHPSDIACCTRKAYLMSINFPGQFYVIPKQQRTFENGHSTHARYQKHLGEMGILRGLWRCLNCDSVIGKENENLGIGIKKPLDCPFCKNPKKTKPVVDDSGNILCGPKSLFKYEELPVIDEELDLHGHTDGIIDIGNRYFVIDFKTCSSIVFKNIIEMDQPLKTHIRQVNIYMKILDIDKACILYENKNTLEIKEFYLSYDEEIINHMTRRVEKCLSARKTGIEPEIPSELQDSNISTSLKNRYDNLSLYCKGFYGYPPCPFFYHCHEEVYESVGGENSFVYKEYDGQYKKFIKVNKRVDLDD